MSRLVAEYRTRIDTDFALLFAAQGDLGDQEFGLFGCTRPGMISLRCGTRYARVDVQLERWDGAPPDLGDTWEDCDTLPWRTVGPGPLKVFGFGTDDDAGLDLGDLEVGCVHIRATGRHRYPDSDVDVDEFPPKRWNLRLWENAGEIDLLGGPPRRLAAPATTMMRDPWRAALSAWTRAGWESLLRSTAFREISYALFLAGRPVTEDKLATHFPRRWGLLDPDRDPGDVYSWDSTSKVPGSCHWPGRPTLPAALR